MCLKQIFDCKKINKYTSYSKINQNLALKNLCCFRQTQKVLKSMANLFVTFYPNVNDSSSTLRVLSGHVSICNMRTSKLLQNVPKILPPSPCMKSWYHDKFHDFLNSFAVNGILKTIRSTSSEHGLCARFSKSTSVSCLRHQIKLLNMNIIFLSIILHYSKHV